MYVYQCLIFHFELYIFELMFILIAWNCYSFYNFGLTDEFSGECIILVLWSIFDYRSHDFIRSIQNYNSSNIHLKMLHTIQAPCVFVLHVIKHGKK